MKKFNKEVRHTFRMTTDQWFKLESLAEKKKQTVSQWLRDRIDLAREK